MTLPKKKILFLTRYSRMGASSRVRTYQYLPFLLQNGWEVQVRPFFNDRYLKELYKGKGVSWFNVFNCYLNRMMLLFRLYPYDCILIEKELFPYMPPWAEWWISRSGKKYVVDNDDAVFHNYDSHRFFLVRKLLKHKIDKVMRYSHKVLVGNSYLAERAYKAGAAKVVLLPTVVDGNRYFISSNCTSASMVKIGWIGSPTTLKYLKALLPIFEKLRKNHDFELVNIGGGKSIGFSGKETVVVWTEEAEVSEIQNLDLGIMPLTDSPWERGKCGYKLIQYMACGLPVIGSPIGINKKLVVHGLNGFQASSDGDWEHYLGQLILQKELREQMGKEGYKIVQQDYTLQKAFEKYFVSLS